MVNSRLKYLLVVNSIRHSPKRIYDKLDTYKRIKKYFSKIGEKNIHGPRFHAFITSMSSSLVLHEQRFVVETKLKQSSNTNGRCLNRV